MPAWRIDSDKRSIRRFDVAASDAATHCFIQHVVLSAQDNNELCVDNAAITATHMQPPFHAEQEFARPISAFGSADLTDEEQSQVKVFVDERKLEYDAQRIRQSGSSRRDRILNEYTIRPGAIEPDRNRPFWRFSCAGFVIEAYRNANIVLVDESLGSLPLISLTNLRHAYNFPLLDNAEFRTELGLDGDGPWRVVLAGYVMNSLNRTVTEIKASAYQPVEGDEYFPRCT